MKPAWSRGPLPVAGGSSRNMTTGMIKQPSGPIATTADTAPSSSSSSNDNAMVLDFGSRVDMSEDARRNMQADIGEIRKSIARLKEQEKKETAAKSDFALARDLKHRTILQRHHGTKEMTQSIQVNHQMMNSIINTFRSQIGTLETERGPSSQDSITKTHRRTAPLTAAPKENLFSLESIQDSFDDLNKESKLIFETDYETAKECKVLTQAYRVTKAHLDDGKRNDRTHEHEQQLASMIKQTDEMKRVNDVDEKRSSALRNEVMERQKHIPKLKETLTSMEKESVLKKQLADKAIKELSKQEVLAKDRLHTMEDNVNKIHRERLVEEDLSEKGRKDLETANRLIQERNGLIKQGTQQHTEYERLLDEIKKVKLAIPARKEKVDSLSQSIEHFENNEDLKDLIEKNNKLEVEVVLPGESEVVYIIGEMEKLKLTLLEIKDEKDFNMSMKTIKDVETKKETMENDHKILQQTKKDKDLEFIEITRLLEERRHIIPVELSNFDDQIGNGLLELVSRRAVIAELEYKYGQGRQSKDKLADYTRQLEVYRLGKKTLHGLAKKEKKILDLSTDYYNLDTPHNSSNNNDNSINNNYMVAQ